MTERDGFSQRFGAVVERLEQGSISRGQAARELAIGYATLKRLLDARLLPSDERRQETVELAAITTYSDWKNYDDIFAAALT